MKTAVFPGRFSSLEEIRAFFTEAAIEAGLNEQCQFDIQLATDEAASNIIDHAYGGEGVGDIKCSYRILDDKLELFLRDRGKPFDPSEIEQPDLKSDVCYRKPGGLGLHFMRKLMDEVDFYFNCNC
jgi:serine/threonine-protein kinase RsbW